MNFIVPLKSNVLTASGLINTSGDNNVIVSPGSRTRIVIVALRLQNESSVATIILLKDNSATKARLFCQNQGDGVDRVYEDGRELKLEINSPLIINLSGSNNVGYSIEYYTEQL